MTPLQDDRALLAPPMGAAPADLPLRRDPPASNFEDWRRTKEKLARVYADNPAVVPELAQPSVEDALIGVTSAPAAPAKPQAVKLQPEQTQVAQVRQPLKALPDTLVSPSGQ